VDTVITEKRNNKQHRNVDCLIVFIVLVFNSMVKVNGRLKTDNDNGQFSSNAREFPGL